MIWNTFFVTNFPNFLIWLFSDKFFAEGFSQALHPSDIDPTMASFHVLVNIFSQLQTCTAFVLFADWTEDLCSFNIVIFENF